MSVDDRTTVYDGDDTLLSLEEIWARKTQLRVRTHQPATVVAYNPATQTAQCTCDSLEVERVTNVPGADAKNMIKLRTPLLLADVPVVTIGSGDALSYLSFPVTPGCTGMLCVMDRDIATWLTRTAAAPVDPAFSWLHPQSSSVLLLGLTDNLHRITPSAGTSIAAVLESAQIYLGKESSPVTSVAIAERVVDAVQATLASIAATLAPVVVPVTGAQVAAAITSAIGVWQGLAATLGSTKTKVAP